MINLKDDTDHAYHYFQRGKELLAGGNPAQAAVLLEKAKKAEPTKGSIRETLGRAYYNFGQYKKAATEFQKTLEIDPTNHYGHFGMSLCYIKGNNLLKAAKHIKLAIVMDPNNKDYQKVFDLIETKKR